jgi:hypothetical protein
MFIISAKISKIPCKLEGKSIRRSLKDVKGKEEKRRMLLIGVAGVPVCFHLADPDCLLSSVTVLSYFFFFHVRNFYGGDDWILLPL